MSAILESIINIVLSIILVSKFGLIGVAIGTLVAMIYRTSYLVWYLSKNIIYRELKYYYKHLCIDILSALIIFSLVRFIKFESITYYGWMFMATKVAVVSICVMIILNFIFYKRYTISIYNKVLKKIRVH